MQCDSLKSTMGYSYPAHDQGQALLERWTTMSTTLPNATREELRARLERERDRLREQIANLRTAEDIDQPQNSLARRWEVTDQADQAMDQAEWDRMHIEELVLSDRLSEVEHALAKFQTNTYGLCEQCGAPIPEGRLRALPEARFDIVHESAFEERVHAQEQLPDQP